MLLTRIRHSVVVRAVVVLLLAWTAADLANASLCALDSSEFATESPQLPSGDHGTLPTQEPQRHVDDCFCCSHCVDVAAVIPAMTSEIVSSAAVPLASSAPKPPLVLPYHPPRA